MKNAKQASVHSSRKTIFSSKTLWNAEISAFSTRKLLVNTIKLIFILLFIDDCLLQSSLFFFYSYSSAANALLNSIFNVVPLLLIVLFLFNVKVHGSPLVYGLIGIANMMGALVLGFNGWGFQPVIAWTTMFWLILFLVHRKLTVDVSDGLYLAVSAIIPLTLLWEIPWCLIHSSLSIEYFTVLYPQYNGGSRLLLLPFLFLQLNLLGWHFKRWMILLCVAYVGWMLAYPYLSWQFDWIVRFPTVAFLVMVMFGGLRKIRQ